MEDLYMWKDLLIRLFNLIDQDHSGMNYFISTNVSIYIFIIGFISRNEFSDVLKLLLYDNNPTDDINDVYIEELSSAMDLDKNGKIDINEFLGKIYL